MSRKPRLLVIPPQHLGHELHVARCIICDMIKQDFISPDLGDSVITGLSDRRFFYYDLFGEGKVWDFSVLPGIKVPPHPPRTLDEYLYIESNFFTNLPQFKDYDIINLNNFSAPPAYCNFEANEEMNSIGYSIPSTYFDFDFKQLARKFRFISKDELLKLAPPSSDLFIIIHHRYGASIGNLIKIINKFDSSILKIIFSSKISDVSNNLIELENLSFTDNLQCYASLLNDPRCKLLVSEWSGGGQISQYTLGPQGNVWYYYDHYADIYNFNMTHKIWELNATLGSYFNCWDFKCVSGCNIRHFPNIESLIGLQI